MIFILPLVVGCIIGFFRGGNLWAVTKLKLKYVWVLPLAYILQYITINYFNGIVYEFFLVVSYLLLIGFCAINYKISGIKIAMVGIIANFTAMAVNQLRMPAYLPSVYRIDPAAVPLLKMGKMGKSIAMTQSTHLNFLGDIFTFSLGKGSLVSIGDILFGIGIAVVIQYAMCLERTNIANGTTE